MKFCVAFFVVVLGVAQKGFSFMLEAQSTNMANVTQELHELKTEVSILKDMVRTLQESSAAQNKQPNPAFMATLSSADVTCPVGAPLIFDRELLDTSNSYDIRHGTFRAPVNGTYVFTTTLTAKHMVFIDVKMVKNLPTNPIGHHFNENRYAHDTWNQSSTTIVVELAAGDDVWLICISASAIGGGDTWANTYFDSHFSGFLVNAK